MKALLVGMGEAGSGWYRRLRSLNGDLELAVSDTNESRREQLQADGVPFYTDAREAIEQEKPDFVINVTPRHAHSAINHLAFDYKLPVLCEKPIAENYEKSMEIVKRAEEEHIPFMIAENYRTFAPLRKLKQLIDEGAVGALYSLECEFFRKRQRVTLEPNDELEEVIIHHFDLLRHLSGREVGKLFAVKRHVFHIVMDLQAGIQASFRCSLHSVGRETQWPGDWRIEGEKGSLTFSDGEIELTTPEGVQRWSDFSDVAVQTPVQEFLKALEEKRRGETDAKEYLKNQALAHYTRLSLKQGQQVDTSASWGYGPADIRNFLRAELKPSSSHGGQGLVESVRLYGKGDFETPLKFLYYSVLPPGTSIGYHGHRDDEEIYIILEGTGLMTMNGRDTRVGPGDVIVNKPWWKHGLLNDGNEPIKAIVFEIDKA
ncbi:cupin domain-containing protein [Paenibacillus dokdonensis]|uniref:cupin domain-containing protein n=1 Tax=Paenibacillus dokdonensis TaxID=2567944 RepID=UPI0010A7FDC5|nr:cupin domain-containing protein [Paenibacillus dokdonensis]